MRTTLGSQTMGLYKKEVLEESKIVEWIDRVIDEFVGR